MTDRALTVVVVTYQSAGVLPGCLDALRTVRGEVDELELVVVDNDSSDGVEDVVYHAWPEALLLQTGSNAGYAAAFNLGAAKRRLDGPVLLLNPDVRLSPGAITHMLARLDVAGVGVVVPRLVDGQGCTAPSLRRDPSVLRAWGPALLGKAADRVPALSEIVVSPLAYDHPHETEWATGAVMLISADCLRAVGPWDESFFLYSEETDFCLRARDLGMTVQFEPSAVAQHLGGDCMTDPTLWSILTVNRVRLARRRLSRTGGALFYAGAVVNEAVRAGAGRATSRAALRALVRRGQDHVGARPPQPEDAPGPVVCFSGQDYWYHNRAHSDVQLMTRLAADRPVLLVNSIGMRMPLPGRSTQPLRRIARKAASTARLLRRPVDGLPGFAVLSPVVLPLYGSDLGRRVNARAVAAQVRWACRALRMSRPTVVVTIPTAVDVLPHLDVHGVVFNHSDKHSEFGETDQALIADMERRLLEQSERVLYVSHALMAEDAEHTGTRAAFLDHGVDVEHFSPGADSEPAELVGVPRPRLGFFGGIDDYVVDLDLLRRVALEVPDAQLVLVGDATCDIDDLRALPNVTVVPRRPYAQIPSYGRAFDVALMPWLDNDWVRYCNPIKLKEYLALGLPVVTTRFPELERFEEVVAVAEDADAFVHLVRRTLADGGVSTPGARRAAVMTSTWDEVTSRLAAVVDDVRSR